MSKEFYGFDDPDFAIPAPKVDTSDEACAIACMLVSNPQGALRKDGDGWQRRVNDLIRALQAERNALLPSECEFNPRGE